MENAAAAGDVDQLANAVRDEEAPPVILSDEESSRVVDSFCQLREKISALEKIKKALYAQLFAYIGTSTEGIIGEHTVSVQQQSRRKIDYNVLERKYPEAYAECVSTSVSTSLSIK